MKISSRVYYYLCKYVPWVFHALTDEQYLKMVYRIKVGKKLDLDNPIRYNEKLQWLKLNYKMPVQTQMVDKYLVRDFVKERIGEQCLVPLLGVWDSPDLIDFGALPNQFVIKCNHDSQGVFICKNKDSFDFEMVKSKLSSCLKKNFYFLNKEWPYKNVQRKIIAEQYLEDESGELRDYKVLCFNGEPKLIEVHSGRFAGKHTQDFYDVDWNLMNIYQDRCGLPNSNNDYPKPLVLDDMLEYSRKLSKGFPHLRVDWYVVNNKLYFGELTFFDASGFDDFEPDEWNEIIGSWIMLPNTKI